MANSASLLTGPLVRVAPAYKFFCAAALGLLAACGGAPERRDPPWAGRASSDATVESSAVDEQLAREARVKAEADRRAMEATRDAQIEREREQAAAAELAAARAAQPHPARSTQADLAADLKRLQAESRALDVHTSERGWVLTLPGDALFQPGGAKLRPSAARQMDGLARLMQRHPGRDIAIEGFTDAEGPDEANKLLSEARAFALREALVARGIDAGRIDARGYGPSFPVASNESAEGRQANRRVEIVINPS